MSGSVPDRITSVFTEVPPEGSEITDAQQWLSSLFLAQRILQLPRICRYYYIAQMMRSSKSLQFYSEEERSAVLNLCLSKMLLLYSVCYFSRALLRHVAAAVVRTDWLFSESVTFSVWCFLFNCQSNLDLKITILLTFYATSKLYGKRVVISLHIPSGCVCSGGGFTGGCNIKWKCSFGKTPSLPAQKL